MGIINLLPNETKKQMRAARINALLAKYIGVLLISVIFLALACVTSYFFLINSKATAEKVITFNQTKSDSYSSVLSQANAINASFSVASSIISQQISYSDIIMGIGAALPSGVVLNSLSVSKDNIGTPIVLKLSAQNAEKATELKANFQKYPLFSGYIFQSSTLNSSGSGGYPVEITIGITITKNVSL